MKICTRNQGHSHQQTATSFLSAPWSKNKDREAYPLLTYLPSLPVDQITHLVKNPRILKKRPADINCSDCKICLQIIQHLSHQEVESNCPPCDCRLPWWLTHSNYNATGVTLHDFPGWVRRGHSYSFHLTLYLEIRAFGTPRCHVKCPAIVVSTGETTVKQRNVRRAPGVPASRCLSSWSRSQICECRSFQMIPTPQVLQKPYESPWMRTTYLSPLNTQNHERQYNTCCCFLPLSLKWFVMKQLSHQNLDIWSSPK